MTNGSKMNGLKAALVSVRSVDRPVECWEAKDLGDASLVQIENILENVCFSQSPSVRAEDFKLLPLLIKHIGM